MLLGRSAQQVRGAGWWLGPVWCTWSPWAGAGAVQLPLTALQSRGSPRGRGCLARSSLPAESNSDHPHGQRGIRAPSFPQNPRGDHTLTPTVGTSPPPRLGRPQAPTQLLSPALDLTSLTWPGDAPDAGDRRCSPAAAGDGAGAKLWPPAARWSWLALRGTPGLPAARPDPCWAPAQMPRSGRGTAVISG